MFAICSSHRLRHSHFRQEYALWAHTGVNEVFKRLEDGIGLRSLLCFLVPTLLSDLPDRRGYSWGIKITRLWRAFAFRDHDDDRVFRELGKGHLSGHELEVQAIRT